MTTETAAGGHPALPAYRTKKVNVVLVLPDPGVTPPAVRVLLEQLAAMTGGTAKRSAAAVIASAATRPAPAVAARLTRESRFTRYGLGDDPGVLRATYRWAPPSVLGPIAASVRYFRTASRLTLSG
jgi:hypothetical protein